MIKTTFKIREDYTRTVSIDECVDIDKFTLKIDDNWAGEAPFSHHKFTWKMSENDLRKLKSMIDETLTRPVLDSIIWSEP